MPVFSAVDCPKDLECAICLEPWSDPVELGPCKHVFCRQCVSGVNTCPECRNKINGRNPPNRILVNMANEVKMECSDCGWTGNREACKSHTVCQPKPAPKKSAVPSSGSMLGGGYQHQQHPQFGGGSSGNTNYNKPNVMYHSHSQQNAPAVIPVARGGDAPWVQYGLSQNEYDQIFSIFLMFDQDDSGELDKRELKKLARWLNFAHTDKDIDAMFRQMDSDNSGALSLEEFCSWLKYNKPDPQALYGMSQSDYNYVLMQFHHFDSDASGELNQNQFIQLCIKCDLAKSQDEARRIFQRVDTDHGGTVDLHEFLSYRAQHLASPNTSGTYAPQGGGGGGQPQVNPSGMYFQQQQQQQSSSSGVYGGGGGSAYNAQAAMAGYGNPAPAPAPAPAPVPPAPAPWRGPAGWERALAPNGSAYYIDHNTKTTHWQPPAGF